MKNIVGIASQKERKLGLWDTLKSLSPQVDEIHVWLNDYDQIPFTEFENVNYYMEGDCGATGKIKVLDFIKDTEFYFFMADDDILYPADYVEKNLETFVKGTIQSSHGKVFQSLPTSSFNHGDISGYYFGSEIKERAEIHAVGTGVCLTDSSVAKGIPYLSFLEYPNMLDIWVSAYCMSNNIKMFIQTHPMNWLKPNPKINQLNSIWETTKDREDKFRTGVYNYYLNSF